MLNRKSNSKILWIISSSLIMCGILSGCGADTVADMNAREDERKSEQANHLAQQYKIAAGLYQGSTTSADVYLKVKVTKVSTVGVTGTSSPTTSLTGSLVMIPKVATVAHNTPLQNTYTFNNGSFDSYTGELAFNVEQTGNTSTVSCKSDADMDLTCWWDVSLSQKLVLKKTTAQNISELRNRSVANIVYTGTTGDLNYVFQFESGTIVRQGSQVPQPAIYGYVTWFNKSTDKSIPDPNDPAVSTFSFDDASYDSLTDSINMVLNDDPKTKVNCSILTNGQLDCRIIGFVYIEVTVAKTVKK
jgi:hypothetical protein